MASGQRNPVLIDNKLVTAYNPYMLANQAMHYAYANTHTVPYTDNYGVQMMRAGYRLQVPGVMHLAPSAASAYSGSDATVKTPVKSTPVKSTPVKSTPVKSMPKPKTEPCKVQQPEETVEDKPPVPQSPAPRKKRRRSRRKKKKSAGDDNDDVDALSDEPIDLHRTLSSSNVSRSSTLENEDTLHFEDEEEFPDLLSASGCGARGSSTTVLSYSDNPQEPGCHCEYFFRIYTLLVSHHRHLKVVFPGSAGFALFPVVFLHLAQSRASHP